MGKMKAEAVGLVESVLVNHGRLADDSLYIFLIKELLAVGAKSFIKKYMMFPPAASWLKLPQIGVTPILHNGTIEIYLQDPDTVMEVMAAFAKAGSTRRQRR